MKTETKELKTCKWKCSDEHLYLDLWDTECGQCDLSDPSFFNECPYCKKPIEGQEQP